jgi:diadenosine tetraphosphatase ApaH/serine/threonine PP2A family protein phosphatase
LGSMLSSRLASVHHSPRPNSHRHLRRQSRLHHSRRFRLKLNRACRNGHRNCLATSWPPTSTPPPLQAVRAGVIARRRGRDLLRRSFDCPIFVNRPLRSERDENA